jgi:transglutaminase-like putative cysteine protease
MSITKRVMATTPDRVWSVLSDGWLYPLWVVGASRIREVEDGWPAVGTRIHHSVGAWPLLIDDYTEVLLCEADRVLELRARAWPTGEASVRIRLTPLCDETEVTIEEDASSGPATLVPKPVRTPPLHWRNVETLRRLAYLAERRAS